MRIVVGFIALCGLRRDRSGPDRPEFPSPIRRSPPAAAARRRSRRPSRWIAAPTPGTKGLRGPAARDVDRAVCRRAAAGLPQGSDRQEDRRESARRVHPVLQPTPQGRRQGRQELTGRRSWPRGRITNSAVTPGLVPGVHVLTVRMPGIRARRSIPAIARRRPRKRAYGVGLRRARDSKNGGTAWLAGSSAEWTQARSRPPT